ncbi:TrkH family potassium uptake protein [Rhodovulum sp. YNF3179]|uniref:TrkH family potassium uptake protein n=1 Tax=Rhodovulum sp. YNF3179 TaxID=3425127 RepID=UPI003D33536E
MRALLDLPLFVILLGVALLAMYVPAIHGAVAGDYDIARSFFYHGTLGLFLTGMMALATLGYHPKNSARSHLLALVAGFVALPAVLALPMAQVVVDARFVNLYFDMVASLTTTGASAFDDPRRLAPTLHLWKGLVAWLGGFLFWLSAIAIMAPLNLGGFEVFARGPASQQVRAGAQIRVADATERLTRFAVKLVPIYGGLTLVLWVGLLILGESALVALCHAMATISTSGLSPVGGLANAEAGLAGEALIFVFLFFAVSRATFSEGLRLGTLARLRADREFQLAVAIVLLIPAVLFLRHWIGALEVNEDESVIEGLHALWGGVFTVLSFLTTHGYASLDWVAARDWSGLQTPGLILMGLALTGGGVATTAGGVKLLRVHALYKHGIREMEKLVHPSSVGGAGVQSRRIRREGAQIAWVFFMLFLISVGLLMIMLSLTGLDFESALTFSIAALSTTGPVATFAAETPLSYGTLTDAAKLMLSGAMILGRLETLVIIALLNPDFWR